MKKISNKAEFFIFLLEKYSEFKKKTVKEVLNFWQENGLTDYINDMYELYHIERVENAIQDIERKSKKQTIS